jgi:hypothetical protein
MDGLEVTLTLEGMTDLERRTCPYRIIYPCLPPPLKEGGKEKRKLTVL